MAAVLVTTLPGGPGASEELPIVQVGATDGSAVIEVVVPLTEPDALITPSMFAIDGRPATEVQPVLPADVTVAVVLDDRPDVTGAALTAEQGSAVELIRNLRAGTTMALATPGGTVMAPSSDQRATIAAVAAVETADRPASTLAEAVSAAAAELGRSALPDRHLVVLTGRPSDASNLELAALALRLADGGIRLAIVDAGRQADPRLAEVADDGPRSADDPPPAGVIEAIDDTTAFINNRYIVTADLPHAGKHAVTLTVGATRFAAEFDTGRAPVPAATDPTVTPSATSTPASRPGPSSGPPAPATTGGASASTGAPTTTGAFLPLVESSGGGGTSFGNLLPFIAAAALLGLGWVGVATVRHRRRSDDGYDYY